MSQPVHIAILVDNAAGRTDMQAEHGLSIWIEYGPRCLLWDTGQSDVVLINAAARGIDLSKTEAILLSHGHYDHTGGLPAVKRLASQAKIFAHPEAIRPRYSKKRDYPSGGNAGRCRQHP